jgi:LysM repeat protein
MAKHRKPPNHAVARRVAAGGVVVGIALSTQAGTASAQPPGGWGPVIACESGGNPRAQNAASSASGLFQFIDSTWRAFGGLEFASRALHATVAEQTIVANRAHAAEGLAPWNASRSCWTGKVGAPKVAAKVKATAKAPKHASNKPAPERAGSHSPKHAAPVDASVHVVVRGDTLSEIAAAAHRDWRQLYTANHHVIGSNPDRIFPGQALNL